MTLSRVGVGSYAGSGRFTSALRCRGRRYPHGLVVPYTVRVQVSQVVVIEGIPFAEVRLSAVYSNRRRLDHTRCPIGPTPTTPRSLRRRGGPLPSPPAATFQVATHPADDSATFTDTTAWNAGGARIRSPAVAVRTIRARGRRHSHHLAGRSYPLRAGRLPGEADRDRRWPALARRALRRSSLAGPPTAAFAEARIGTSRAYAFQDARRTAGTGGAAITGWLWSFSADRRVGGEPVELPRTNPSRPPSARLAPTGVCLLVTDANGRRGEPLRADSRPRAGASATSVSSGVKADRGQHRACSAHRSAEPDAGAPARSPRRGRTDGPRW